MKKLAMAAIVAATMASPAMAYDRPAISIGLGADEVFDSDSNLVGNIEWRGSSFNAVPGLSPMAGLEGDTEGALYVYGGVLYDWKFSPKWALVPSFGIGAYHQGDSVDLGGALEFRSALELDYSITPASAIGVQLNHKSNAHIYDHNPGTEELLAKYTFQY
jgi:hypothetical protein